MLSKDINEIKKVYIFIHIYVSMVLKNIVFIETKKNL